MLPEMVEVGMISSLLTALNEGDFAAESRSI